jgi:DNA-binding transcriptional LysR family regulator
VVEEHFRNLGAPLDPRAVVAEVGSLAALRTAACAGVAAAFVSRAAVQDDLEAGRLRIVPVAGVRIPRRFYVAWPADRPPRAAARRFVELARGRGSR